MNIAIIPARGGSKRLPGKNIKDLAGKPMIAWTIEAALDSGVFDYVFVSTDSEDIAIISKDFGAEVPFLRPDEISTDIATTNDVVTHLVEWFEEEYNREVITVAILQPTSPLRNAQHIQEAFKVMKDMHAKAVISVCELEHPIQFCNKLDLDGSMNGFIDSKNIKRTQDLEPYYRLNGAIYLFGRSYVNSLKSLYSKGTYSYIMDSSASIDIDTKEDFKLAEFFKTNGV
ncbi:pseudaminic acid cytidylyltransferase [Psychrobacter sp. DAB_AL43B]|uniref:pseudaminic acid cytidylyltransferase n=1 Tax=Psychrobacter sp. DAB_AL43B TaxID=1028416 RepID=UPI0009C2BE76|nr:pseudaminic acid cytidylyltransferase [Psychrobacter sp. DAB_AL43B]SLJ83936.1 N-acylneuraminate cytidylyltransferase [Psychrobacter sp. DAB_AL43B]